MSKHLILLALGAWLIHSAGAQTYFNKRQTLHSGGVLLSSVAQRGDKYYTDALCIDSINSLGNGWFIGIGGVRFSVWDKHGRVLHDTVYQRPDSGSIETANNALMELPDHTFLVPASGGDTKGHLKLFLFCFDSTARLLWQREYNKPADFPMATPDDFWQLKDFKPDGYGNYLMLSGIFRMTCTRSGLHRMLLTKLDSSFNIIWNKDFGDNVNNSLPGHLIVEPDGYTFGGWHSNNNWKTKNYFFLAEIFKTDTGGNQQWHWLSDSSRLTLGTTDLIHTRDGGYLYCGQGAGVEIPAGDGIHSVIYWWPWIEKIDRAGKPLWHLIVNNHHTIDADNCSINKLIELPDGDIIAAGQIVYGYEQDDTLSGNFGTLLRLRLDGTVKWKHKYTYQGDTMTYRLYDMKQTVDGGYIMAGEANDEYHTSDARQRAWLIKVDSNGCTGENDPQCWPVSVPHEPVVKTTTYKVYPNPATDVLQVSFRKEQDNDEVLTLTDITGRTVSQSTLSGLSGSTYIDVKHLQPGIYLYRITGNGMVKASGKITKQ